MGDRGQVMIHPDGAYLYTHWDAKHLIKNVKTALKKRWRWDHPAYLTRIIFDVMTKGQRDEETGFGIGRQKLNVRIFISINTNDKTVGVNNSGKVTFYTFEEFIGGSKTKKTKVRSYKRRS